MKFVRDNRKIFKNFYLIEIYKELEDFEILSTQTIDKDCLYFLDADQENDIFNQFERTLYRINIIEPLSSQLQMFQSQRCQ